MILGFLTFTPGKQTWLPSLRALCSRPLTFATFVTVVVLLYVVFVSCDMISMVASFAPSLTPCISHPCLLLFWSSGAYHVWIAYATWKGFEGYSYNQIPEF